MKEEKDVYTFDEFQKYITGTTNLNDKTMFEMLYANSVTDSQKYYELTPPKTSKGIRALTLTEVLYNDLVILYNEKKKYYGFNDKWFIFGEHEPLTFGMMSRINDRIAKNADIRRIVLHCFRHSCASLLINNGANIKTVAKYLGHTKIDEALNTYSHIYKNKLNDIVNTINNLT